MQLPTELLELNARATFGWKRQGRQPDHAEEMLDIDGALLAVEPATREAIDALLQSAR